MIGSTGARIEEVRKRQYRSVDSAVQAMNKVGYSITSGQFYELQAGQWPSRLQIIMLADFFGVSPEYLMFGVVNITDDLKPSQHGAVERLVEHFREENKALSSTTPPFNTPNK